MREILTGSVNTKIRRVGASKHREPWGVYAPRINRWGYMGNALQKP